MSSLNFDLKTFCDHAAHGRLADVQRMLELPVNGNLNDALVRAAAKGQVDVVDCLLRHAMFDPSADDNRAILLAARKATSQSSNDCYKTSALIRRPATTTPCDRLLVTATSWSSSDCCKTRVSLRPPATTTPSDGLLRTATLRSSNDCCKTSASIRRPTTTTPSDALLITASSRSSNDCCKTSASILRLTSIALSKGLLRTVTSRSSNDCCKTCASMRRPKTITPCEWLLRAATSRSSNDCCKTRASIRRPLTTTPCEWAAAGGHLAVVERLLEDDRVDAAVAIQHSRPEHRKRFECRERLTEICIALQDLALPAWITVQILDAARPWSTLPLHSKWNLVCAVKHFHDKHNPEHRVESFRINLATMCARVVCRHC
jgi:hypothetical protein